MKDDEDTIVTKNGNIRLKEIIQKLKIGERALQILVMEEMWINQKLKN